MWRLKTVVIRDKKSLIIGIFFPIIFLLLAIFTGRATFQPDSQILTSGQEYIVATSQFNGPSNVFINEDTGFKTTQDFKQCHLSRAASIGLILDSNAEGNSALQSIYTEINSAYNYLDPMGMRKVTFDSQNAANDYVKQKSYPTDKLCFTLRWSSYDTQTAHYALQIGTDYRQSNITDPNLPQNNYYDKTYSKDSFTSFNATDYLEVMAIGTKVILDKVSLTKAQFYILYTPMSTGDYKSYIADSFSVTVALVYEMTILSLSILLMAAQEKREDVIELILKRLGVQKSVIVAKELILGIVYGGFWCIITTIALWFMYYSECLGFLIYLIFVILYLLQTVLRQVILGHVLSKLVAMVLIIILLIFQLSLSLQLSQQMPSFGIVVPICMFSPMMQIQLVLQMATVQLPFNRKLDFNSMTFDVYVGVSLATVLVIAIAMIFFYVALIVYIWPIKIDVDPENPAPWYYPISCKYWRLRNANARLIINQNQVSFDQNAKIEQLLTQGNLDGIEVQDSELKLITNGQLEPMLNIDGSIGKLVISHLTKSYGDKNVVDGLNLTIYQNEILVLLGHNGAGKTTTLNMLTGLIKATSGAAIVYNVLRRPIDLFQDYQNIADFIGLCPQVDVLFLRMTIKENLIFYCRLKNVENMDVVIEETLAKFNLTAKANAFASQISGGQKRKLQLAIALLGNSKIVLLDEPTSGMDPTSRRETWEIIKQAKQDKIIILTTHYMDEAEYLADRVAVVSCGSLKICGSTSFLKTKFGRFLFLEVEPLKQDEGVNVALLKLLQATNDGHLLISKDQYSAGIIEEIPELRADQTHSAEKHVLITTKVDETGKIVYKLPNYLVAYFREIFEEVDQDLARFGIKSYSIRNMNLEQVFLAIGEEELQKQDKDQVVAQNISNQLMDDLPPLTKPSCFGLLKTLIISQSTSYIQSGAIQVMILLFIITLFTFTAMLLPLAFKSFQSLDYSDLSSLYNNQKMKLMFNANYIDASSNEIVAQILQNYPDMLISLPQSWNYNVSTNLTDFLVGVGNDIAVEADNIGAYYINYEKVNGVPTFMAVVYANASSPSAFPAFGNMLLEAIGQTVTNNPDFSLKFEYTTYDQTIARFKTTDIELGTTIATNCGITVYFLEFFMIMKILGQTANGFYRTTLMRGATPATFVFATIVPDLAMNLLFFEIVWLVNIIYGADITGWQELGLLWCVAQTFLQAAFNIGFNLKGRPVLRFVILIAQMFLLTFSGNVFSKYLKGGESVPRLLCLIFLFSPSVQLLYGLIFTQYRYQLYSIVNKANTDFTSELLGPFSEYGARLPLIILCSEIAGYGMLLLVCLNSCHAVPKAESHIIEPEEDKFMTPNLVKRENDRVEALLADDHNRNDDALTVKNLVKRYYTKKPPSDEHHAGRPTMIEEENDEASREVGIPGFNAVKGTTFSVRKGEIFTLLGVNGAGKSSTFNCLVGLTRPSGGTIYLGRTNSNEIVGKPELLHGLVGYCPQTNIFDGPLTVKQTVTLFARLVGITDHLAEYVDSTILRFGLTKFVNTQAMNLSGGNQRKLSLVIAMIGRPKIICIDEASTGVDPSSRRTMWKAIRHEGQESAVILTTHAMEEAEAISSKLAIQVSGWFRSFGTLQEVQREGDSGYFVDLKIDLDSLMAELFINQGSNLVSSIEKVRNQLGIWEDLLRKKSGVERVLNYAEELKPYGLLDKFYRRLESGLAVDLRTVLRELLMQDNISLLLNAIERAGMRARIQNYDGAFVSLQILDCQMSFGQIYAFMDQIKQRHHISEYSCTLSSLEQVFSAHATQSIYIELNKRLLKRASSITSLQD